MRNLKNSLSAVALTTFLLLAPGADAQVLAPRGDGSYQRYNVPSNKPRDRATIDPIPGTGSATIRDRDGRAQGSVRRNSWDNGYTTYDRQGRRTSD